MSSVRFEDLDPGLQRKIDRKPGRLFMVVVGLLTSLVMPILVLFVKDVWIDRPKERVELTYDISQPEIYMAREFITDIEVINIGKKDTGDAPVILEAEFGGKIWVKEWRVPLDQSSILAENNTGDERRYTIRFRNFGPGASFAVMFKTEEDLVRLPILKHQQVFFSPRVRNTLRKDLR